MNTYLLFINGKFESTKDIDDFSVEFVNIFKPITSPKFVIENQYNIIVIFDSDSEDEDVASEIKTKLTSEFVLFYFLFNREDIMVANMPQEISALLFKDLPEDSALEINLINKDDVEDEKIPEDKVEDEENNINGEIYVDTILDKIEKFGIESLTEKEKKFLDNFKK